MYCLSCRQIAIFQSGTNPPFLHYGSSLSGHSWLFTKKRGNRRTGSRLSGILAETLFASLCLISGVIGLVWIFTTYVIPEWQVHDQYVHTVCTVMETRVTENRVPGDPALHEVPDDAWPEDSQVLDPDTSARAEAETEAGEGGSRVITAIRRTLFKVKYKPEVLVKYEVDDVTYKNWTYDIHTVTSRKFYDTREEVERMLEEIKPGTQYHCWYDPDQPQRVVLVSYWTWEHWLSLMIPVSLILLGGGMLLHLLLYSTFGSREYTVVNAQRTSAIAPFLEPQDAHVPYPNIPDGSMITDSPGVRLAYRLPMDSSFAWQLLTLCVLCVLWNIFVIIQLFITANTFLNHQADWLRLIYTLPFAASGIALMWIVLKHLRNSTKIGLTFIEIDRFPIRPGQPCKIFISQGGRLRMYWLNVMVVCEEEVIFTHGTNTRREIQRVFQKQLFCEEGFEITQSSPFECEFILELPKHAMHSFVSARNQVKWQIVVEGAAAGCPVFTRIFPMIVYPQE